MDELDELYHHEDDYCGTELVPMENEIFIKNEQDEIFDFAEKHRASIGYKFNEINIFIKNNGKYITHLWFDYYLDQLDTAKDLYKIIKIIVQNYDLIFVDWSWGFYSRVKYDLELENKLIEIYKELSAWRAKIWKT